MMWLYWFLACSNSKVVSDLDGDGFSIEDGDCDDSNVSVAPNMIEICDGLDNDCNGTIDDASGENVPLWYPDIDGDGFGILDGARLFCPTNVPEGFVQEGAEDCDDTNPDIHPDADEFCDGLDNDCDSRIDDEPIDQAIWYPDQDSDSYGDPLGEIITQCDQPSGYVENGDDCDDANAAVNPIAEEFCDQIDNDCNSLIDDGVVEFPTYFLDADGDGFGGMAVDYESCDEPPAGYVTAAGDCDDFDLTIFPGSQLGIEAPNNGYSVDINCDGLVACTDIGCDGTPELWTAPSEGSSEFLRVDGQSVILSGLTNILLAEKVPLQDDRHARILTLSGDLCVSNWLSITMEINAPEVTSLNVSSVQAQQVLVEDTDGDNVSDIVVIAGYGPDDELTCPTAPNLQIFKMQLQNSGSGPDLWRVHQTGNYTGIQGVDAKLADLDGNGTLDIVLCTHQNELADLESSQILYDAFAGPSGPSVELAVLGCRDIEIMDWDNDGATDIVMAGDSGQHLFRSANNFEPELLDATASQQVMVMDADANSQDDLLFVPLDETEGALFVFRNGSDSLQSLTIENCTNPEMEWLNADTYPELICPDFTDTTSHIVWGSENGWQMDRLQSINSGPQMYTTFGYWSQALVPSLIWMPTFGSTFGCEVLTSLMETGECSNFIGTEENLVAPIVLGPPVVGYPQ